MLKAIKGIVKSDIAPNEDGSFKAKIGKNKEVRVAYTSPSYVPNQGGIFAPPKIDQEVLLFETTNPKDNKPVYFYVATIVDDPPTSKDRRIPEFKAVRTVGDKAYNRDKRPVKMTLQNTEGQGISVTQDLSKSKRASYTSLDAETGGYISAGEQGCHVVTEHMDGITVQADTMKPGGPFPYRSITMTSQGPLFQESGNAIQTIVGKGGSDITIANLANTPKLGGAGSAAGNIRIHSQNKDITLATGSPKALPNPDATRNVNIVTPAAEIQVNGTTGAITIRSKGIGSLSLESNTSIDMNAPLINVNGTLAMAGGGMSMSPEEFTVDMPVVNIRGRSLATFQSDLKTTIDGRQTTIQGDVMKVHSKTKVPPVASYEGLTSINGVNFGVTPLARDIVPPIVTLPLPTPPGNIGTLDPAAVGIPGIPSVVTRNAYFDIPTV